MGEGPLKEFPYGVPNEGDTGPEHIQNQVPPAESVPVPDKTGNALELISDEERQTFDTAINTDGFSDFLQANPDTNFDAEDIRETNRFFELFKQTKELAENVKFFVLGEMQEKAGPTSTDVSPSVDTYITSLAYSNPERVLQMLAEYQKMTTNKADMLLREKLIADKKAELGISDDIDAEKQDGEKKAEILEKARESLNFWTGAGRLTLFGEKRKARAQAKEMGVRLKRGDLDAKIAETKKKVEGIRSIQGLEAERLTQRDIYKQAKREAVAGFAGEVAVSNMVSKAIREKVSELIAGSKKPEDLANATKIVENIAEEGSGYFGVDAEALKNEINEKASKLIIGAVVEKIGTSTTNIGKIQEELSVYLAENAVIGTEKGDRAREALEKILRKTLADKRISGANKLLIGQFLASNRLNKFK